MKHLKRQFMLASLFALVMIVAGFGTALAQDAPPVPPAETGMLDLTCGIESATETEIVTCQVMIDAVPQPDQLPGQVVSYPLPLGDHTVLVTVAGELAAHWEPASLEQVVSITSTTLPKAYTAKFIKLGHLVVTLMPEAVTADFYVDTVLVGTQVATLDVWLSPNKSHTLAVKNVVDPAANGIYGWNDQTKYLYTTAASDTALTVTLVKKPIKGFLKIKCVLPSVQPTDVVVCRPTIDGTVQADLLPGTEFTYPLDKGSHTVQVDLVGDSAFLWAPQTRTQKSFLYAGSTTTVTPKFTKSGHLLVALDQPGVVADFYVDGVLAGTQVAGLDLWVTPYTNHKVEVKALTDPASGGLYVWKETVSYASVAPGAEKVVTVALTKVVTAGYLLVGCIIDNVPPPEVGQAYCTVYVDDVYLGAIVPNESTVFLVSPGPHHVRIFVGPENEWSGQPWEYDVDIVLDETAFVFGIFYLNW